MTNYRDPITDLLGVTLGMMWVVCDHAVGVVGVVGGIRVGGTLQGICAE